MSGSVEIYKREICGVIRDVESVTAFMGIYLNSINGFWYAVDWDHKHRGAFRLAETARIWCEDANKVFAGLPNTNPEISRFNDALKLRGWFVAQLMGDCQVWERRPAIFDAGGRYIESADA